MSKNLLFVKPSTFAYDGLNTIDEIMGEYNGYLSILSNKDLAEEFKLRLNEFSSSMSIANVRMYLRVREKMLERGLQIGEVKDDELNRQM